MNKKIVYLDTGGLWSLDALLYPQKHKEPRWKEYFAYFCDIICDPTREIYCALPDNMRLGAPLPTFYQPMFKNKLLSDFDPLGPKVLETAKHELDNQFEEFNRHISVYSKYYKVWFDLHNHKDIRDGWRIGVPDQSKKWEGVPKWLDEYISEFHISSFQNYENKYNFPIEHTTLLFSFIQRGHSYSLRAANSEAEYLTHPIRWQVSRKYELNRPDPLFGIAIGGLILGLLESGKLERDAEIICEYLANLRSNIKPESFFEVTTLEEAKDLVIQLVPSFDGAYLNPKIEKYFRATLTTILAIANSLTTGFSVGTSTALWIIAMVSAAGAPIKASATEAKLFRKWIDYPKILGLDLMTCPKDGGIRNLSGFCPSCDLREKQKICEIS